MATGQWTHLGHTHAHTHSVHTYSTTVGRSDSWLSLFCEWSLVQMCDCIIINVHFYILSLWSPGRRRNHVQEERSEEVHLSVLIISKFLFFPFVSFLFVFNSLSPPTLIHFIFSPFSSLFLSLANFIITWSSSVTPKSSSSSYFWYPKKVNIGPSVWITATFDSTLGTASSRLWCHVPAACATLLHLYQLVNFFREQICLESDSAHVLMLQTTGSVPNRLLHLTVSPYSVCLWSVTVCTCRLTQVKKKEIIGLSQCYQFTTPPSGGIKSVVATNSETTYTTFQTDREVPRSTLIYRDDTEIEASIYFHFTRLHRGHFSPLSSSTLDTFTNISFQMQDFHL